MKAMRPAFPPGYAEEDISEPPFAVATAMAVIETIFVGLRCYSRYLSKGKTGWDDLLVIIAFIPVVSLSAISIAGIKFGRAGHHAAVILVTEPESFESFQKLVFAFLLNYFIAQTLCRLGVIVLTLRIFAHSPAFRVSAHILLGINIASGIAYVLVICFICKPITAFWDIKAPNASCLDIWAFLRWWTFPGIFLDALVMLLPVPMIMNMLLLSWLAKLGLVLIFTTGGLSLVVSIIRLVAFMQLGEDGDLMYYSANIAIYSIFVVAGHLIALCVPVFRPLVYLLPDGLLSRVHRVYSWVQRLLLRGEQSPADSGSLHDSDPTTFSTPFQQRPEAKSNFQEAKTHPDDMHDGPRQFTGSEVRWDITASRAGNPPRNISNVHFEFDVKHDV